MFHRSRGFAVKTIVLGATLLACPCGMLAQRGPGGGHVGGGTAGGEGLSGGGKATGVEVKDELKDFHEVLAEQATSQQIIQYAAMLNSTNAARAKLQTFLEQLGKPANSSQLAGPGATLLQAIEEARTQNRKFLEALSEPQKSGLKEVARKLVKADSDLAQQARQLNEKVADAKSVSQQIADSAQGLDNALADFKTQQIDLGEEMSIGAANNAQDSSFNLPTVTNSIRFANQPIAVTTSGVVSRGAVEGGQNTFNLELTADMSDLQLNIADVLRNQLDKAERCGEQIAIQDATLTPQSPVGLVVAQLHFERWACFGGETMNELAEGNGSIEVKLTPAVAPDGTLRLAAEIGRVDAQGLLAELLRSGSLGDEVRDKIAQSVLFTMRQGGDFKAIVPPAARANVTLHHAEFQGTGSGKLLIVLDGEIKVPNEKLAALTSELKGQSSSQQTAPQALPR
ncbi:MAG: hypothetical protein WA555_01615 [Candidatus Sulfotelmatobacter sp.]